MLRKCGLLTGTLLFSESRIAQSRPKKKIIEYVWYYGERMNWQLPPEKAGKGRVLPPDVEEALVPGRQKYDAGKPLGYDIVDMIKARHQKGREAEAKTGKPDKKP